MTRVYLAGRLLDCSPLVDDLVARRITVSLTASVREVPAGSFLLVSISDNETHLFEEVKGSGVTWAAWCHGQPDLLARAYTAGALAAFPHETGIDTLSGFIIRQLGQSGQEGSPENRRWSGTVQRNIRKGDLILLDDDFVLDIEAGIIAKKMIHRDGCEVLLGLYGKNSLILPHPSDDCYIQLVAHSDCVVRVQPLESRQRQEDFTDQLRINLQRTEAWAAMQARPHLDLRVLGILSLLADEFGETTSEGRLLNVRLTHAQLASATGSTRATITRTISDLKKLGKLSSLSTAEGERYCLLTWDSCSHLNRHPAN